MRTLKTDYERLVPSITLLESEVVHQLQSVLDRSNVTLAIPIEHRVKSLDSIEEKIRRNGLSPDDPITNLPDLVGLRIVLVFRRDLLPIQTIVESMFEIIDSEDTANRLSESQFGYQSHHYICRIRKDWAKLPSLRGLGDFQFEVQIRTAAQHIWAAASHKLQYKRESSIPSPLRRTIHRVAALLETVDLEFERVLSEREDYESGATVPVIDEVNVVSLRQVLEAEWPEKNRQTGAEDFDVLVQHLQDWGVTSVSELERLIQKHKEAALKEDRDRGFFTLAGMTRNALGFEFGQYWFLQMPEPNKPKKG